MRPATYVLSECDDQREMNHTAHELLPTYLSRVWWHEECGEPGPSSSGVGEGPGVEVRDNGCGAEGAGTRELNA